MDEVYTLVRNSQLEAYLWLNTARGALEQITTWEELLAFLGQYEIEFEDLII